MSTTTRTLRSRLVALAAALLLTASLTACSSGDTVTLYAEFEDVIDLVERASVRAGDVPIGIVSDIELTEDELARVTMEVDADVVLSADTEAWLSKTSLLGERFIDLRPQGGGGQLEDGTLITATKIVTDFEDLVGTGADVLAGLSAQRLATAIQAGAESLGGRGELLGTVIDDVQVLVARYEGGSGTLTRVIDELAALTAELAPDAEANAADLELLRQTTDALDEQDEQLFRTLMDLQRLATVGERIMQDNADLTDENIRRLRVLLEEVNDFEGQIGRLLENAVNHNTNVPDGAIREMAQIWGDFVVCGASPGLSGDAQQDEQGNPSDDCTPPNPGRPVPPPEVDPCPQPQVRCPYEVEGR